MSFFHNLIPSKVSRGKGRSAAAFLLPPGSISPLLSDLLLSASSQRAARWRRGVAGTKEQQPVLFVKLLAFDRQTPASLRISGHQPSCLFLPHAASSVALATKMYRDAAFFGDGLSRAFCVCQQSFRVLSSPQQSPPPLPLPHTRPSHLPCFSPNSKKMKPVPRVIGLTAIAIAGCGGLFFAAESGALISWGLPCLKPWQVCRGLAQPCRGITAALELRVSPML